MAVFEKDRASRRYYSKSSDPFPEHEGGIPIGSMLTYTDTGDRFIFDEANEWLPFIGEEDLLGVLEEIRDIDSELLGHIKIIRAATATLANDQSGGNYSTDDE